MVGQPAPEDASRWALLLKTNWRERATSASRDFYVASHPGWNQRDRWEEQAAGDVQLLLHGLTDEQLRGAEVLEIGCGVGRLVPALLERVGRFSGCDVAPEMVHEAQERVPDPRARFVESDGKSVPASLRDRQYDLAFSFAVLVHCPRVLIAALTEEAVGLLKPGGRFRFQVLADASDPEGIEPPSETVAQAHGEMEKMEAAATPVDMSLIEDRYYMGHRFRYAEARELFGAVGTAFRLHRLDAHHIYGEVIG